MSSALVDWGLAQRIASSMSGGGDPGAARSAPLRPSALDETCARAQELVRTYAALEPGAPVPAPETVDRPAWVGAVMPTLKDVAAELERSNAIDISLPGPLGGLARSLVAAAGGTEIGLAAGYASRKVLGQYDVALLGADRPPRLLFVAPNIVGSAAALETDLHGFVRWVALHETTHALQFAAAPWLREHLGGLIRDLLSGAVANIGARDLVRRVRADPKGALSSFLRGDLAGAIAGPERAPTLDRIQAAMTFVEGHAEHVMDAAGADFVPGVETLRARLERRRRNRGPLETIMARLLGLDLKLRQYRVGKEFCDGVVEAGGIQALNRIWAGPGELPDLCELERPGRWLARTGTRAAA
jgi:coenzyme F420 biosynthesis associated uncharacterized protein